MIMSLDKADCISRPKITMQTRFVILQSYMPYKPIGDLNLITRWKLSPSRSVAVNKRRGNWWVWVDLDKTMKREISEPAGNRTSGVQAIATDFMTQRLLWTRVLKWLSSKRFLLYHSNPLSSWSWNDQFWEHTDLEVSSDTHNCYWSGIVNICEMKSSLEWVLVVGDSKPEGDVRLEKDNAHIHTSTIRSSIDHNYLTMCTYFFTNQTYKPNNIWRSYDRASWWISYYKPTRCTKFTDLFGRKLCMVRTVPLSIIRSFSMYTQQ
jgi:hypothetical protein